MFIASSLSSEVFANPFAVEPANAVKSASIQKPVIPNTHSLAKSFKSSFASAYAFSYAGSTASRVYLVLLLLLLFLLLLLLMAMHKVAKEELLYQLYGYEAPVKRASKTELFFIALMIFVYFFCILNS